MSVCMYVCLYVCNTLAPLISPPSHLLTFPASYLPTSSTSHLRTSLWLSIAEYILKHIYHSCAQLSYNIIQINIQPKFSRIWDWFSIRRILLQCFLLQNHPFIAWTKQITSSLLWTMIVLVLFKVKHKRRNMSYGLIIGNKSKSRNIHCITLTSFTAV